MGVSTLHESNIKGFAFKFVCACPVWIEPYAFRGQFTPSPNSVDELSCISAICLVNSCQMPKSGVGGQAIPENRLKQKIEIQFFSADNNSMSIRFGKKLVTQKKVTTNMLKLVTMHVFDRKKLNFHFLNSLFSGIAGWIPIDWCPMPQGPF